MFSTCSLVKKCVNTALKKTESLLVEWVLEGLRLASYGEVMEGESLGIGPAGSTRWA